MPARGCCQSEAGGKVNAVSSALSHRPTSPAQLTSISLTASLPISNPEACLLLPEDCANADAARGADLSRLPVAEWTARRATAGAATRGADCLRICWRAKRGRRAGIAVVGDGERRDVGGRDWWMSAGGRPRLAESTAALAERGMPGRVTAGTCSGYGHGRWQLAEARTVRK